MGLALLDIFDTDGALALEQHAPGKRFQGHHQVRAPHHRVQIAHGGGVALAVADGDLEPGDAFLLGAVDVLGGGDAGLDAGVIHGFGQGMLLGDVRDGDRPALGVELVLVPLLMLGLAEIGQHVGGAPALAAHLPPAVVIGRLAADIEQAVDRG